MKRKPGQLLLVKKIIMQTYPKSVMLCLITSNINYYKWDTPRLPEMYQNEGKTEITHNSKGPLPGAHFVTLSHASRTWRGGSKINGLGHVKHTINNST